MSGGVGGIGGDSVPSVFPSETVEVPEVSGSELGLGSTIDSSPEFLELGDGSRAGIALPEGRFSLFEWAQIISEVIQKLRESLNESEFLDAELAKNFHSTSVSDVNDLLEEYAAIEAMVDSWNSSIGPTGTSAKNSHEILSTETQTFNTAISTTVTDDITEIQTVNNIIEIVNDPVQLQNLIDSFGGDETATLNYINSIIQNYNDYLLSRADLQAELQTLNDAIEDYNDAVDTLNSALVPINGQRSGLGLPQLQGLPSTPTISNDIQDYVSYEGTLTPIPLLTTLDPPPSISPISVPNPTTDLTLATAPVILGKLPRASYSEAFDLLWVPFATSTVFFLSSLDQAIELSNALVEEEKAFQLDFGKNIILPSAAIESARKEFIEDISGPGTGVGLAGFAMGLHSKNLEIALSSALIGAVSQNYSTPISAREFARLKFTALELLSKSARLTPLPAARFLVSSLGTLSADSPVIAVALAEALINQVSSAVGTGVVRSQVNAVFNRQLRSLGFQSIGGLAGFTEAVSATQSLSILSVALAQLGRRIGMPGLVAQFFAQGAGIPTTDLLIALNAGSRILDVLDNPISVLFLKQTLTDSLVFERGFTSSTAGLQVNSAVNNIALKGNFQTFSHLKAEALNEFQRSGFSLFQANLLANETVALIRGDLGVQFLNVAFGLNFDPSVIASSIANNILGIDVGIAGAMLSNAVVRSLLHGGFGSRVRLKNELLEQFQGFGLSRGDASGIADQTLSLIESLGLLVPLNRFPGVASLLLGEPVMRAVAFGSGLVREELLEDLEDQGLTNTQAELIADQLQALASGTFKKPEDIFARSIEEAIGRTTKDDIFQTQREFRDRLLGELRAVGFNRNSASFLSNSVASFGATGNNISILGVSAAKIAALNKAAVSSLSEEFGITNTEAQNIFEEARSRAVLNAPFSSGDQFKTVLREEIQKEVINRLERTDGYVAFDRAVADLADPNAILSLPQLTEQLSIQLLGVLRPDLGARKAEIAKDQILDSLLGATTIDKIENPEQRNPLSVLNQINTQVEKLLDVEEEENQKKMLRKLMQLLQSLLTPNAEVGFLLQSLMDNPSTFIGSLLVQKPKGEFLDIPI